MLRCLLFVVLVSSPSFAAKPKGKPAVESTLSTSTPAPTAPAVDSEANHGGGKRRVVELTPERLSKPIGVRGAPNVATVLSLPEPWAAAPSCGDCIVGAQAAETKVSTLWRIDLRQETNEIVVKPIQFPGPDLPLSAFETSLDVTLVGGTSVSVFLTLAEIPSNADLRVDFKLPAGADVKSRRTAIERELRGEYDQRVAEAVKDALAETMMSNTRCKDFAGGPRQTAGLIVRVRQMCRNATYVYIVFEVENGGRNDLTLASAALADRDGAEGDFSRFKKPVLLFRERSLGFAALPSVDPNAPSGTYSLSVVEDSGEARKLLIDGIQF